MKANRPLSLWRCACRERHGRLPCRMPPAPDVMAALFMEYRRCAGPGTGFAQYLLEIGFVDPSVNAVGMDDRLLFRERAGDLELLSIPRQRVTGGVRVIVLLVDFDDRAGHKPVGRYEDLLFSLGKHPTGSMRDYYREVSLGKVDVTGTVHGWLRMPESYAYYVNDASGTDPDSYPRNAKRLAEDAVRAALAQGIAFEEPLDHFSRGFVTALFVVHAGRGAEMFDTVSGQRGEIWSHKWSVEKPVQVAPNLSVTTYLTVPHDCKVGVCAHELGHLAFQWQDFYDPNYQDDGEYWDGAGVWDLMAGGAHNNSGASPAHPAALHKLQHGWIVADEVAKSGKLRLEPCSAPQGRVCKVRSPAFTKKQYLLLENRRRQGFDFHLPGEGLLVWKIDEAKEMFAPARPGMSLVQADGRLDLDRPGDSNEGDASDPFPGSSAIHALGDGTGTSTSFPGKRSGIRLSGIQLEADGSISLNLRIAAAARKAAAKKPAAKEAVAKKAVAKKAAAKKPAAKKAVPQQAAAKQAVAKRKPVIAEVSDRRVTLEALLAKTASAGGPQALQPPARGRAGKKAAKPKQVLR